MTEQERIALIEKEAARQKQNKLEVIYAKSKARLKLEIIEQVNLLIKSGIKKDHAWKSARDQQKFDNHLTYLIRKSIKDKQLKLLKL